MANADDIAYMRRALELAGRGAGFVSPNPMVGAVIVKDGRVIGEGYHHAYGMPHAEADALASCSESARGATVYVTLEPCAHHGKQPPCADALVEAGAARVVTACDDPNPLVAGRGYEVLRRAGVTVERGVLEGEGRRLNEVFFHYMTAGRPFVLMKYAMTLDGKIACRTGASKWITGPAARRHVHETRHRYSAVMVGVGTVVADDPLLTCRIDGGVDPLRIVCDTQLRTPHRARLVRTAHEVPTLIATCRSDEAAHMPFLEAGCELLVVPEKDGRVDLASLMDLLAARDVDSVLLEGGAALNWAAVDAGIVDKVHAYVAPKLFGGAKAATPVAGYGFDDPARCLTLAQTSVRAFDGDVLVEGYVVR